MIVYTIGHSTRSYQEFVEILKCFRIDFVIDVRKFPYSKRFPHFSKANLEESLLKDEISYLHFGELGGFREEGYLTFSQSRKFASSIIDLQEVVDKKMCVVFCAEVLWWRCHRKHIAHALIKKGYQVIHIFDKDRIQKHEPLFREVQNKMQTKLFCDKIRKK